MKKRIKLILMFIGIPIVVFPLIIIWLFTGKYSPVWYFEKITNLDES